MVVPVLPTLTPTTRPAADIPWLNTFLVNVGSFAEDWIFGVPAEASLFHYTDLAGLVGILTTGDLWLTHSRFSNDEQELTHGYDLARRAIEESRAFAMGPDWTAYLDRVAAYLQEPPVQGVYIACRTIIEQMSKWCLSTQRLNTYRHPRQDLSTTSSQTAEQFMTSSWRLAHRTFFGL